jgi:hypothetical protein
MNFLKKIHIVGKKTMSANVIRVNTKKINKGDERENDYAKK